MLKREETGEGEDEVGWLRSVGIRTGFSSPYVICISANETPGRKRGKHKTKKEKRKENASVVVWMDGSSSVTNEMERSVEMPDRAKCRKKRVKRERRRGNRDSDVY